LLRFDRPSISTSRHPSLCAPTATGARTVASALNVATAVVHRYRHTPMSDPRQEDSTDTVKAYLKVRLEIAEKHNCRFSSHDHFFKYLREHGDLNKRCEDWIDNTTNRELREFFNGLQNRKADQPDAAHMQAPLHNLRGPSVPHVRNVPGSDSGIGLGSDMDDQPMYSPVSQKNGCHRDSGPPFDVHIHTLSRKIQPWPSMSSASQSPCPTKRPPTSEHDSIPTLVKT
jgi:hypothetical protein